MKGNPEHQKLKENIDPYVDDNKARTDCRQNRELPQSTY